MDIFNATVGADRLDPFNLLILFTRDTGHKIRPAEIFLTLLN